MNIEMAQNAQKQKILELISTAPTAKEYCRAADKALDLLEFIAEVWFLNGYGYKYNEIVNRMDNELFNWTTANQHHTTLHMIKIRRERCWTMVKAFRGRSEI
jgi:hypothetical protein